mgnify:CR=1 FL=1
MSVPTDGGPAFPIPMAFNASSQPVTAGMYFPDVNGMSLRDWFAGQASEADIENNIGGNIHPQSGGTVNGRTREQAKYAYADAMLRAREAPTT